MSSNKKETSLQYEFFEKVCLSSGGMKKHAAKKHPSINTIHVQIVLNQI